MSVGEAFTAIAAWFLSLRLATALPALGLAALCLFGLGFAVAALRRMRAGPEAGDAQRRATRVDLVAGVACAVMAGWGLVVYV